MPIDESSEAQVCGLLRIESRSYAPVSCRTRKTPIATTPVAAANAASETGGGAHWRAANAPADRHARAMGTTSAVRAARGGPAAQNHTRLVAVQTTLREAARPSP